MTSPADPVQLLVDRDEIHDLVMRYARGVDTRDMEAVRSCFAPDCDVSRWGPGMTDREAMIDYISGVGHFHTTMHMMGNQFVEVDGDAGQVDSYAMLTHHSDDRAGRTHQMNMSASRYVERVARRDGRWVVTQRGGEPRWAPIGVTAAVTDDPATQWLLDRAEIHDLMMQYALGVDLRDYGRVRACFASPFHAAYGEREFTDLDTLVEFISGVEHFHSTNHFLGTQLVEVVRDDAWMTTYSLVTHRPNENDPDAEWVAAGIYRDRLVREHGRWRIRDRGPTAYADHFEEDLVPMPASEDPRVQALLDRAEIHDAVVRSALALDEQNGGLTHHFLNNQLVAIERRDDGDRADAETYLFRVERDEPGGRPSPWSDGARRWVDDSARVDGRWSLVAHVEHTNRVADELVLEGGTG